MVVITSLILAISAAFLSYFLIFVLGRQNSMRAIILRRLAKLKVETAPVKKKSLRSRLNLKLFTRTFFRKKIIPMLDALQEKLMLYVPKDIPRMFESRIQLAGKSAEWTIERCVLIWFASTFYCAIIAIILFSRSDLMLIQKILIGFIGAGVGAILPFVVIRGIIQERQKKILKQLPEFLDLLCVSVQAGLSFEGAASKITSRMKGPLIDEMKHMQRDGQMGIPRRISLQQMAKRCDMEEVYLFTTSVIQSERLGTSMAKTLTVQAENMRERHRQQLKAMALKAPVKIVFPLIIFILPAFFIVACLPTALNVIKNFNL